MLIILALTVAPAATIWNGGPPLTFSKSGADDPTQAANQDRITANVWITRGGLEGIYNAKSESSFTHFASPADTEWADGSAANFGSLTFTDWNTWVKVIHPPGPPATVNLPAVVHLISDDIYIDIKFTSWFTGGDFSYQRATAPAATNVPPSVIPASIQRPSSTSFQFSYSANVGLSYVLQRSLDLSNWTGIVTNVATNTTMIFRDDTAAGARGFYRVGRLPNP
jgi:hypothetical protein